VIKDAKVRTHTVTLGSMVNDARVQRALDKNRVTAIADNFTMEAIGVLTLSARDDGTFSIIDGQHRYEALREKGYGNEFKVTCRVFYGLSLANEAELFRLLNNTRKPQPIDLFRVRVIEGDETAVAISDMLGKLGWVITMAPTGSEEYGAFRAVVAIEKIWKADPVAARWAIQALNAAWGKQHNSDCMDGRLVEAFGLFYMTYGEEIDLDNLILKVIRIGGARDLISQGISRKKATNSKRTTGVVIMRQMVHLYNKGLRKNALERPIDD
jgi:hypothetical protein